MKNKKISNKVLSVVLSSMFVMTSAGVVNVIGYGNEIITKSYAAEPAKKEDESQATVQKDENKKIDINSEYNLVNNLTDVEPNAGNDIKFDFVGGTATLELKNYETDSKNSGYLLIDINKDFVKDFNNKYFSDKTGKDYVDDAMRVSTNYTPQPTVIQKDFCSYSSDKSGYVRFYVPYQNATGKMTVTFTLPASVQKKIDESIKKSKENFDKYLETALKVEKPDVQKIEYKKIDMINENRASIYLHTATIKSEDLLTMQTGQLVYGGTNDNTPVSGFVNIDAYVKAEKEKVYKGFVFDDNNKILRIRPNTRANKVRLYLGAGDTGFNFSSRNNVEFDVKYYNSGSIYRKVNDGKVHNKNDFKNNEYDRYFMGLGNGFRSIDIPLSTTDGIIEIKLNGANNFLLNLKVEALEGGSLGTTVVKPEEKPVVNEKLDSKVNRISGSNRYSTAIDLSKKSFDKSRVAVVASGQNFADALAGGALAAANKAPLLLVENSSSTIDDVNNELRRLGVEKVYVLGGKNAISVNTEMKITNDDKNDGKMRTVVRLSGENRYETSYEIYKEVTRAKGTKESPILVNGNTFADALSAGALSANTKRGIILTDGHSVNPKIDKNSSDNIIIGGTASMDSSFKGKRISGANRYDTSVNVAKYFDSKKVMLASGEKYPDGLASITLYHKYEGPLLLTPEKTLPTETKNYIKNNKIENVYIVGGTSSVSSNIENMFK